MADKLPPLPSGAVIDSAPPLPAETKKNESLPPLPKGATMGEEGAVFGVYPKQRSTPSSEETKRVTSGERLKRIAETSMMGVPTGLATYAAAPAVAAGLGGIVLHRGIGNFGAPLCVCLSFAVALFGNRGVVGCRGGEHNLGRYAAARHAFALPSRSEAV